MDSHASCLRLFYVSIFAAFFACGDISYAQLKLKDPVKALSKLSAGDLDLKSIDKLAEQAKSQVAKKLDDAEKVLADIPASARLDAYKRLSFGYGTLRETRDVSDPGPPVAGIQAGVIPLDQQRVFERVIGDRDFLPVVFLQAGVVAQKPVGRIAFRSAAGAGAGWGTGFLVSKSLLLTNNHVIAAKELASHYEVQMNYQLSLDGQIGPIQRLDFDPESCFITSAETDLDYTLIRVRLRPDTASPPGAPSLLPGDVYGYLRLGAIFFYSEGQAVNIIQHPDGRPKEIAIQANRIVQIFDKTIRYTADTEGGSSGSPVFSNEWTLIGLHHSAGEQGPDGKWLNNEGVRMDKIAADLKAHASADIQAELGL